jgi:hypothetical protein
MPAKVMASLPKDLKPQSGNTGFSKKTLTYIKPEFGDRRVGWKTSWRPETS